MHPSGIMCLVHYEWHHSIFPPDFMKSRITVIKTGHNCVDYLFVKEQ